MLLLLLFAQFVGMAVTQSSASTSGLPRLHVVGTHIEDSYGREVSLHGINVDVNNPSQTGETDIAWIKSSGFNSIRAIVYPDTDGPGLRWSYIDGAVNLSEKYGLYVIIDMHQDGISRYFDGSNQGLPDRFFTHYDRTNWKRALNDMHYGRWSNFVDRNGNYLWDYIKSWWSQVAARYAGRTVIAGYDLENEMYWPTAMHDELFALIKTYDPNVIGCYTAPSYDFAWLQETNRQLQTNVVWSPHGYWLRTDGSWYESNYNRTKDFAGLQRYIAQVAKKLQNEYSAPIWWGEFFSSNANDARDQYVDDSLSIFESFGQANWAYFSYAKVNPPSIYPRDATGKDMAIVSTLQKHMVITTTV